MLPRAAEVPLGVCPHAGCRPRLHAHHVALAHLAEVAAAEHGDEGGPALRVVVLQRLAAPWRREGIPRGAFAEGSEPRGGELVAAPRVLVGHVVLPLSHEQHEHLAPVPAPAPERAVRAVHQDSLELGRGLLVLGLGRLALDVPVDYEAAHVHLLVDAEVERHLGLHVMSSRLVRRGNPLRSPCGRAMQGGGTRVGRAVPPPSPGAGCGRGPRRCARLARWGSEGDLEALGRGDGAPIIARRGVVLQSW